MTTTSTKTLLQMKTSKNRLSRNQMRTHQRTKKKRHISQERVEGQKEVLALATDLKVHNHISNQQMAEITIEASVE